MVLENWLSNADHLPKKPEASAEPMVRKNYLKLQSSCFDQNFGYVPSGIFVAKMVQVSKLLGALSNWLTLRNSRQVVFITHKASRKL